MGWDYIYDSVTDSATLADPLILSGSNDVKVKPGTGFVLGPLWWLAEATEPILPDSYFGAGSYLTLELILDGQKVLAAEDCQDYYVAPQARPNNGARLRET